MKVIPLKLYKYKKTGAIVRPLTRNNLIDSNSEEWIHQFITKDKEWKRSMFTVNADDIEELTPLEKALHNLE